MEMKVRMGYWKGKKDARIAGIPCRRSEGQENWRDSSSDPLSETYGGFARPHSCR